VHWFHNDTTEVIPTRDSLFAAALKEMVNVA